MTSGLRVYAQFVSALADLATADLSAHDRVLFIRGVLEREDVTSTAIGDGVAIPHARTPALPRCRVAVGVLPNGIPWGASDGRPVQLALLIAARESDHAEHLRAPAYHWLGSFVWCSGGVSDRRHRGLPNWSGTAKAAIHTL